MKGNRWQGWMPVIGIALVAVGTAVFAGEGSDRADASKFDRVVVSGIPDFRALSDIGQAKRACNDICREYRGIEDMMVRQLSTHAGNGFGGGTGIAGGGGFGGSTRSEGPYRNEEFVMATIGIMRAQSAVPALLKQIDRRAAPDPTNLMWFPHRRPAFEALVKIGYPACEAAAHQIAQEENNARRELLIDLIRRGVPRPVGKALLTIALERPSTTKDGAKRIEAAIAALDEPSPKLPRPKAENAEANQEAP